MRTVSECQYGKGGAHCHATVIERHGQILCENHMAVYEWSHAHEIRENRETTRMDALEARIAALEKSR